MRRETDTAAGRQGGTPPIVQRLLRIVRQIIGAPDYQAYLEHCRTAGHPPRLTEREYVDRFFESKGKGVRCC
ncbi:MAG TPA: CstA-like transporter-associated (seleno)protein [Gemmatimonadales bacterium]|nr:CstA-like transporter-associated (seleno)protein [Gemmatimonadales bacterium]HZI21473.1 CstA-like transporter-associated (seleno)protein [Gemmatimonadales bacterium]